MKRAFTLIELLVVIAIIAILAAILFPVFAQAKVAAKKAVVIAQTKQYGTAINIYLSDSDDTLPLAFGLREPGLPPMVGVQTPFPPTSVTSAPWTTPYRQSQAAVMVTNSCAPYMKNFDIIAVNVANKATVANDTFLAGAPITYGGLSYNGLLSSLNSSSIQAVSSVPLVWTGFGNGEVRNRSATQPALNCTLPGDTNPCQFNAGGPPQAAMTQGTAGSFWVGISGYSSVWTFERKGVFVRVDSSAKAAPVGSVTGDVNVAPPAPTLAQAYADPFQKISDNGNTNLGAWIINCSIGNASAYWCYFRPDRDQ